MEIETDNPFEKVLDRLRERGWCKGELGEPEGPNCLLGADMYLRTNIQFYHLFAPIMRAEYPKTGAEMVSTFNNHPDTTFSDVERVLEKAAVKWEEERVMRDD